MAKRTLAERVGILEQKVAMLEQLPAEVAALRTAFVQFRTENSTEHSAINKSLEGLQRLVLLTFPFNLPL